MGRAPRGGGAASRKPSGNPHLPSVGLGSPVMGCGLIFRLDQVERRCDLGTGSPQHGGEVGLRVEEENRQREGSGFGRPVGARRAEAGWWPGHTRRSTSP